MYIYCCILMVLVLSFQIVVSSLFPPSRGIKAGKYCFLFVFVPTSVSVFLTIRMYLYSGLCLIVIGSQLFPESCLILSLLSLQLSFQMWTNQMQETLNSKKKGDSAFRHKDFRTASECYTQVKMLTTSMSSSN